jgi:hypothetical protein
MDLVYRFFERLVFSGLSRLFFFYCHFVLRANMCSFLY